MRNQIDLNRFQLETYTIELPFERLKLGVDNVRYDVYVSSEFRKVAERFIFELIIKYAEASPPFIINPEMNKIFLYTREFIRKANEAELILKGQKILKSLETLVDKYKLLAPPKIPIEILSSDYYDLCAEEDSYTYGIEFQWLAKRIDCSKLS